MSERLKLKKDAVDGEARTCPSCGASLHPDAVICLQCGFDFRTGKSLNNPESKNRPSPLIVVGTLLAVAAAIVVIVLRQPSSAPPAATTTPPPPPGLPAAPTNSTTASSMPAPEVTSAPAPDATAAITPPSEAPAADVDAAPIEPSPPAIDWAAVESEQRQRAVAELNRRAPLFDKGEPVELRLTNGIVHRGVFKGLQPGGVELEIASNEIRQVPALALDRATRLRVDPEFRERYIEYHVRQRLAELRRAETNAP